MRLMQRLAISGLLSVILILLLTGTFVTRRDLASVVDRGIGPEERNEQVNPAFIQDNVVPGQDELEIEGDDKDKNRRLDSKHKQAEYSAVGPPPASLLSVYVIRPPNPPLDDVTNQRREKVKEMMKHGWDNYVRYAWGKNELRPISKRGHSASIFGASTMGATIVDGLDTLYIMGLHDEFKQGRDWIAENLDFDIIKRSLEHIKFDFKMVKDDNEIKILKKYAFETFIFSLLTIISGLMAVSLFITFECTPIILDSIPIVHSIIYSMNISHPHKIKMTFEFFIDEECYFYFYLIYEIIVISFGLCTMIATGLFLNAIINHCCATYKIASKLIENSVTDYTLQISASQRERVMHQKICRAVHIHRRSMQFLGCLLDTFHAWYLALLMAGVASLSFNLFRLLNAVLSFNDLYDIAMSFVMVIGHFLYMFRANFCGQIILDHSAEIFNAAYNTLWYVAPLPIQKLLLFVMQGSSIKKNTVMIADVFTASFEGFATLVTSAISYVMVMYTLR